MDGEHRKKRPLLSAVFPFLNEEDCIPALVAELDEHLSKLVAPFELTLVDDGSRDQSVAVAKAELSKRPQIRATVRSLSRNFGQEAALTAGLEAARGDVVVPLNADLEDPPALIQEMLADWRKRYELVYAVRRKHGQALNRLWVLSTYGQAEKNRNASGSRQLQALRESSVVNALLRLPGRSRFMQDLFAWIGSRQIAVCYDRGPQKLGQTNWNYWKLWNFAINGVTSFSRMPLQVWSYARLPLHCWQSGMEVEWSYVLSCSELTCLAMHP